MAYPKSGDRQCLAITTRSGRVVESVKPTSVIDEDEKDKVGIESDKNMAVDENDKSDEAFGNPESSDKEKVGDDAVNVKMTSPKNANPTVRLKMPHIKIDPLSSHN